MDNAFWKICISVKEFELNISFCKYKIVHLQNIVQYYNLVMEYLKRKLRARQPKMQIKKNETFKAKTTEPEQKKVPLKTIFKKVRTGEDGSSIYMIKSTNDTPVNAPLQSDITEKNAPNFASKAASTVCSQIPDFTTEDIVSRFQISHLRAKKPWKKIFRQRDSFLATLQSKQNH